MKDTDSTYKYRQMLQTLEQEALNSYDKTVLTLSGGALAVSFAFVDDIVGKSAITKECWLIASWIQWGFSVMCVLFSLYAAHLALRKAVRQVDEDTINEETPGGHYDRITAALNALGGLFFLGGIISMSVFATENMR